MPRGHISKRTVDAFACPPGKDREILWDDALPGFGLVAFPSGRKCYCAQYRQGGQSRRITIGQHGRLAPDEARREAKKLLGAVEMGANPVAQRRAARAAPTVADLIAAFLEGHAAKLKPGTAAGYAIALAKVQAAFGNIKAEALTRTEAASLHRSLAATPYQANRTLAALSALYAWAERHGHLPEGHGNPAPGIKRYREQGRERFLTAEELNRLGEALREAETNGLPWDTDGESKHLALEDSRRTVIDPFAAAAVRLLILTGTRLREVLHARWEQVDFERGLLNLADSKTGRKPVYLNAAALAVLTVCRGWRTILSSSVAASKASPGVISKSLGRRSPRPPGLKGCASMTCATLMHRSARVPGFPCQSSVLFSATVSRA